jgi:hypothetical protein
VCRDAGELQDLLGGRRIQPRRRDADALALGGRD